MNVVRFLLSFRFCSICVSWLGMLVGESSLGSSSIVSDEKVLFSLLKLKQYNTVVNIC